MIPGIKLMFRKPPITFDRVRVIAIVRDKLFVMVNRSEIPLARRVSGAVAPVKEASAFIASSAYDVTRRAFFSPQPIRLQEKTLPYFVCTGDHLPNWKVLTSQWKAL